MEKKWHSFIRIFYKPHESSLREISLEQYKSDFGLKGKTKKAKAAFNRAWESRNFEIELYWKRATYFWAFLVPVFAAVFTLFSTDKYHNLKDDIIPIETFMLIGIGFILSLAWVLANKGSKSWQRHWEIHVEFLEDKFTGPLYKTLYPDSTFSVTKINEIISWFFTFIWILLGVKFFIDQDITLFDFDRDIEWMIVATLLLIVLVMLSLIFGYGRGYFSQRDFKMHRRTYNE